MYDKELKEFISDNKKIIDKITPKNPSIPPDDEWMDEDFGEYIIEKKED